MSRPATTHRRSTTVAAVLALTALALLLLPAIAGADEAAVVLGEDATDGVALGEGSMQVDEPTIGGILDFDEVTVTTSSDAPVSDTIDEPVDIGQGPITDDGQADDVESDGQADDTDDTVDDAEVLDEPATDAPSDAICTDVLVRISPDRVQGDQRAVAITSQMIELGVERWVVVAWQAAPSTELTAVSIVTPTGVETRTSNLTTGTADNVVELVFCGSRSSSPDPDLSDVPPAPQPEDTGDATDPVDAEPTPETDETEDTDTATPTTPAPPASDDDVTAAAPTTPAPSTPAPSTPAPADDATAGDEPTSDAEAAGTVDDEDAEVALDEDAEVLGMLEERDDTDATDDGAQLESDTDTQTDPEASADEQAGADEDAEVLGLLEDRASDDDRGAGGLLLTLLSLLVAALAAFGAWTLLRRRAAEARTTDPS